MAINFPTSLDNFTNPSSGNTLDSPSHSLQHSDINDAVEAMQRKVGVGTAVAGSASAGQVLTISAAGTSTWSTPSQGLTLISTTSFTAQSSVSLPAGTFSATYKNYKILTNCSASVGTYLTARLRTSGSDNTATAYTSGSNYVQYNPSGNPTSDNQSGVGNNWSRIAYMNADDNQIETNLMNPFVTGKTSFYGFLNRATDSLIMMVGGSHSSSASFDSLTLIPFSGTITGSVSVYGFNI